MRTKEHDLQLMLSNIYTRKIVSDPDRGRFVFDDAIDFLEPILIVYSSFSHALRAFEASVDAMRDQVIEAFALTLGAMEYSSKKEAERYYDNIAGLGREHPEFLGKVIGYSRRVKGQRRFGVNHDQQDLIVVDGNRNALLGSLLIQPPETIGMFLGDFTRLRLSIRTVQEYMEIAKEHDPTGLKSMRDECINALVSSCKPADMGANDGTGLELRRLLFDGKVITSEECGDRVRRIAEFMYGGDSYMTLQKFSDTLEAVGHSPMYLRHCLINDFYRTLQAEDSEYSMSDPCEENHKPLPVRVQQGYLNALKDFLTAHGFDHRISLAPWVLSYQTLGQGLDLMEQNPADERWLDREVVKAAGAWLSKVDSPELTCRAQARRYSWIRGLSERDCIDLCEDEHQRMACFKAAGFSSLIHKIKSEKYRESIFTQDLGI